jgi:aspartate kinase
MVVLKFGGTSVESGPRIAAVARLAAERSREGCLVVVSALGGATDELLRAANFARRGELARARAALEGLRRRHADAVGQAGVAPGQAEPLRREIEATFARLGELLSGIALLSELTPRTSDALLSAGELLSSRIVAAAIRGAGGEAVWCDPRDLVATSRDFGLAVPDEAAIADNVGARLAPLLARGGLAVTGGFVGREPGGETTTLGRGGSDYTASLLGAVLGAAAIEIWTDVDGLMTADPRVVPEARLVPEISYAEASELAFFGAKVLHPATIRPAVARGIPVLIRNSLRPSAPGTVILPEAEGCGVRALAARPGAAAILVSNPRMLLAEGYASRVFAVFERHRVPVDVIATSEVSISTTVDARSPISAVVEELARFSEVRVIRDLAVVSVVGRGLRTTAGIAGKAFAALDDINVVLISQGASETNLTFVVAQGDAPAALSRLHRAFFGAAHCEPPAASPREAAGRP